MAFRVGWRTLIGIGFAAGMAMTIAFFGGAIVMEELNRAELKAAKQALFDQTVAAAATDLQLKTELLKARGRNGHKVGRRPAIGGD